MFKDKSLIPGEAIRLATLGLLAMAPRRYADLASETRTFVGGLVGPSLDLMVAPLELMVIEGLVEPVDGEGMNDNATLRLTAAGHERLQQLLTSTVRAPINDIGKLVIALKMRFLNLLSKDSQIEQFDMLIDVSERELARLTDLRTQNISASGFDESPFFAEWLEHDIAQVSSRLVWLRDHQETLLKQ